MNSEMLIRLFEAITHKSDEELYKLASEIIEEEKKKNHHLLAKRLYNILQNNRRHSDFTHYQLPPIPRDNEKGFRLLEVKKLFFDWKDVILSKDTEDSLKSIVRELEKEDILATYGLRPKRKILFYGLPGTGKTLSAKVLSSVLGSPLVYIKFESVISSYLGETASNLRKIFDFIEKGKWVVLFDEFDIIGKKRDDPTEHGEIKRVVNNFMLMLENYEGESLIIAATNHPQLLDMGVWRRFDDIIYFDMPDKQRRKRIFKKYLRVLKKDKNLNLDKLAEETEGFSGADIEQLCLEALKRTILEGKNTITNKELNLAMIKQRKRIKIREGYKSE